MPKQNYLLLLNYSAAMRSYLCLKDCKTSSSLSFKSSKIADCTEWEQFQSVLVLLPSEFLSNKTVFELNNLVSNAIGGENIT